VHRDFWSLKGDFIIAFGMKRGDKVLGPVFKVVQASITQLLEKTIKIQIHFRNFTFFLESSDKKQHSNLCDFETT
jgi:hypothetical protein